MPSLINGSQQIHTHTDNRQILTRVTFTIDQKSNKIGNRKILRTNLQNAQRIKKTMRETTQMLIYSVEHNLVGYMV